MSVSLNIIERVVAEPNLLWDTTWDGFVGEWAADATTKGFRARSPLHTAILLCLMSDRRAEANDFIPDGSSDPRGWAGDAIDPAIAPLGSRLWQLRRRELTDATADLAVIFAQEALKPLVDQGVVARFDVSATAVLDVGRLELNISAFRQDGQNATAMQFWVLWKIPRGVTEPLAP